VGPGAGTFYFKSWEALIVSNMLHAWVYMNVSHCSHLFSTADGFLQGISHIGFSAALNEYFLLDFVLDNTN
jgi:hypothetical protein